jgi:hypothetical protein
MRFRFGPRSLLKDPGVSSPRLNDGTVRWPARGCPSACGPQPEPGRLRAGLYGAARRPGRGIR